MPPRLEKLQALLKLLNEDENYAKTKDVAQFFTLLTKAVQANTASLGQKLSTSTEKLSAELEAAKKELRAALGSAASEAKKLTNDAIRPLETAIERLQREIDDIGSPLTEGDVRDMLTAFRETLNFIEEMPEITPEQVRDKLESLDGPSKLKISAIFGLQEALDELRKRPVTAGGTNFVIQRGAVRFYDLSDQLDGIKTTFALPAFGRVLSVQSTSTPITFRPTVDYTVDGAAMTISFTSQIDAATTLSEGQSLIVLYAEN